MPAASRISAIPEVIAEQRSRPLISIITVTLNAAATLEQSIGSVFEQSLGNFELIIVDGNSTDGSGEIIKRHAEQLAWWVSESDLGISDAMNKGITHAQGEWLLFLHADDALISPSALTQVLPELGDGYDIVACSLKYGDDSRRSLRSPRAPGFWLNFKTGFLHQATLIKRELFDRIGLFDSRYKIAMDYEFFLRAYRRGATAKVCPGICLALMGDSGVSSHKDWPSLSARLNEERLIHNQHCTSRPLRLAYSIYWGLYRPYRRIRATLGKLVRQS